MTTQEKAFKLFYDTFKDNVGILIELESDKVIAKIWAIYNAMRLEDDGGKYYNTLIAILYNLQAKHGLLKK